MRLAHQYKCHCAKNGRYEGKDPSSGVPSNPALQILFGPITGTFFRIFIDCLQGVVARYILSDGDEELTKEIDESGGEGVTSCRY